MGNIKKPVVLFAYNRPELTIRTAHVIRQYQPETLFLIVDGPKNQAADFDNVEAVRQILDSFTGIHRILRLYRENNLGCRQSIASGLTWIFEQVDECIVLEDDCLPDISFFDYCATLLDRYRNDTRIMTIGGFCPDGFMPVTDASYCFSKYPATWGWATWRRAFNGFVQALDDWCDQTGLAWLEAHLGRAAYARYWAYQLRSAHQGANHWDYAWAYHCWKNSGVSVHPAVSMIQNIGFGHDATHTQDDIHPFAQQRCQTMDFPMTHPKEVRLSIPYDDQVERLLYSGMQSRRLALLNQRIRNMGSRRS
jgi:hypothetical protein